MVPAFSIVDCMGSSSCIWVSSNPSERACPLAVNSKFNFLIHNDYTYQLFALDDQSACLFLLIVVSAL